MTTLQTFVSRSDSLRVSWANQRWNYGIQPFFLDHVPFSLRNGPAYASRLVSVYESVIREQFQLEEGPFHVIEFGAGLGYLSYHFMDQLETRFPVIFSKTVMHVSDAQEEIVSSYTKSGLFDRFGDRVELHVLDAVNFELEFSPTFSFSTYLLDSLNAYSLAFVEQNLMEIQVESFCNDDSSIVDLDQNELKLFSGEDLLPILTEPSAQRDRVLSQAVDFLEEGFRVVPFSLSSDHLSTTVMNYLQQYLTEFHDRNETLKFNMSASILEHLQSIYAVLKPGGAYVVSDFGFSDSLNDVQMPLLTATYGLSCYMMVAFPFYDWVMNQIGATTWRTQRESDQTQEWVIQKSDRLVLGIKDLFIEPEVSVGSVLDQLVSLPNDEHYMSSIQSQVATLSQTEKMDYFFLSTVIAQLLDDGYFEESEQYFNIFCQAYGDSCFESYRTRGFFAQNKEQHEEAIQSFKEALVICPHDGISHAACGMSYMILGEFDLALSCLKQAFQYTSTENRWQHMLALLLAYKYSGHFEVIIDFQSDIKAMFKTYSYPFPDGIYDRLVQDLCK